MLEKIEILNNIIKDYKGKKICLAYSGGVDSCLLLAILKKHDIDVCAITFNTTLHPKSDAVFAKEFAKMLNAKHEVININEFADEAIMKNPVDRCYHCKSLLFKTLREYCKNLNIDIILDGTNYDDLFEYRPGLKALKELDITSPLAISKLTKNEIRQLALEMGLVVHKKPSTPCMATRLPYNDLITIEKLNQIEKSEEFLKTLGFDNLRVRYHNNLARIEIPTSSFFSFIEQKDIITTTFKEIGFDFITLDIEGFRSGSFDKLKKDVNNDK